MSIRLKAKKYNILWPIYLLKYILPIFFVSFFGQTYLLIISLFFCKNGKSYYNSELSCRNGTYFYVLAPFSIIALIIQIFFSFITVSVYYQPEYIINKKKNYILIKRNSLSDIVFLFCKILIISILTFAQSESEKWEIIIFFSAITFLNAYFNLFVQKFSNLIIKRLNNFLSLNLFFAYLILFIEKIFQKLKFSGGIYLYIISLFINFLFCIYYSKISTDFLTINFNDINSSIDSLKYIKKYIKIIDEKDTSRDNLIIFNSFIQKTEEICTNKRCALKKYLESLSKGNYSKYLLLQYCEKLFKSSISKFPEDIILRINYIIFLFTRINKKKEAKKELISINPNIFSFNDNFNLYLCEKYLKEYFILDNEQNKEKIETINMMEALKYKNYLNEFKILLLKSSSLYYDFWSALYNYHIQGIEDFTKLNDTGNQLNKLIENIENLFIKLNEIKKNDYEIIKLYESFSKNILNDEEKYSKYNNILKNLSIYNKIKSIEIDFSNFNLGILNENDEKNLLIISVDEKHKGIIMNISLKACLIFGYQKDEIVGKNFDILIPELFQKIYIKKFNDLSDKTKNNFYNNFLNKTNYKPEFIEIYICGKNKSKYLIPLYLKLYLVQTEENELVYIIEIIKNNVYKEEIYHDFNSNDNSNICCVLTNNNLIIQTFTSNCVDILKFNSNIINSNYEIISFIKQFDEEFQINNNIDSTNSSDRANNNENNKSKGSEIKIDLNKNSLEKLKNYKLILKTKFHNQRKIIWRNEIFDKESILYIDKIKSRNLSLISHDNNNYEDKTNNNNIYEQKFLMMVREICISDKIIGYYFYFKKNIYKDYNKISTLNDKTKINNSLIKYSNNFEEINKEKEREKINKNNKTTISHQKIDFNKDINFRKNANEDEKIKKYIPESSFNFVLDLNTMSFIPSNIIKSSLGFYEKLKNEALTKINSYQEEKVQKKIELNNSKTKISSSNEEEIYSDESNSNNSNSSYISQSESEALNNKNEKDLKINNNSIGKKNTTKYKNNIYEEYYIVNIKNIKYVIFDFNKEVFVEAKKEDKKSHVEYVIDSFKSNKFIYASDDDSYPKVHNLNNSQEKNKSTNLLNENKEQNSTLFEKEKEKEKDYEKVIKDALSRKDEQNVITQFYGALFLCTLLFFVLNVLEIFFFNQTYTKIKENMKLVINSANLNYYNNFDIYFLREYLLIHTLFNNITNGNYINYPSKKISYDELIYKTVNETFYQSHCLVESIFSSELSLSKNSSYMLTKMSYFSETLINKTLIKKTSSTLSVSIVYVYSFFCSLLTDKLELNIHNPESFNFVHNALNNLGKALQIIIELFLSELKTRKLGSIFNMIFIMLLNFIIYISMYKINDISYFKVVSKKMSYLTIFYEIKLSIIKLSIQKCESFINKINKDEIVTEKLEDNNEESISAVSINKINSLLDMEEKKNKDKKEEKKKLDIKIKKDKKYFKFRRLFKIFLTISFLFICTVIIFYILLIRQLIIIGEYIYHMQNYHNNILYLYNGYREFLFDENSIIFGMPSNDYLISQEKKIYLSSTKDFNFLLINNYSFKDIKNELNKTGLCNLSFTDFFKNEEECQNFMGGEKGIISLGFDILLNYFIEEIRMKRNYAKGLMNKGILVGNLSELNNYYLWDDDNLDLKNNQTLIFRMNLFNKEDIHQNLNIIFINIIYQYINKERNLTLNSISQSINNGHIIYIILIACHCSFVIISILFYLIPEINKLNIEIYKTKNILSIIPVQILASLPNIKTLLKISIKNNN